VLDALVEIQRTQDPTLAFRYACRCRDVRLVRDGGERPGAVGLPHAARVARPGTDQRPSALSLPAAARSGRRHDAVRGQAPGREARPSRRATGLEPYALVSSGSAERHEIDLAIECIGCGMCVSACTMVGHNDRFPGPAALNRALTLELDHRDGGRERRWRVLLGDDALARCHGQGNCYRGLSDEPLAGRFDSPASAARRATVVRSVGLIRLGRSDLTRRRKACP
jgi:fumarate reductase iron-sulfur subunit